MRNEFAHSVALSRRLRPEICVVKLYLHTIELESLFDEEVDNGPCGHCGV